MKKGEKVSNNTLRKKQATDLWLDVVREYTHNITPPEIAKKHINPYTNKPYTVRHIYLILRQMNVM